MDKNEYREEVLRQLKILNEQQKATNERLDKYESSNMICDINGCLYFVALLLLVLVVLILFQNFKIGDIVHDIDIIRHTDDVLSPFYKLNDSLNRISNSLDSLYEQIAYIRAYMR